MHPETEQITTLLQRVGGGDRSALSRLWVGVFPVVRRIAAAQLAAERRDHTLQPTALANETFLYLFGKRSPSWHDRAHFFGTVGLVVRHILVDRARIKRARGKGVDLDLLPQPAANEELPLDERVLDLEALDRALRRLEELHPRPFEVVNLRFFAGRNVAEAAALLGISVPTVKRDTRFALARLRELVGRGDG